MRRSLPLAAYLAYARRAPHDPVEYAQDRPQGTLIWAHAVTEAHKTNLSRLASRIIQAWPWITVLITHEDQDPLPPSTGVLSVQVPPESMAAVDEFLSYWKPDICLWTGGNLRPALLTKTHRLKIPMLLADADVRILDRRGWRWLPDVSSTLLGGFAYTLARSQSTAQFLQKHGVSPNRIAVSGPLQDEAVALPYNQSDRDELSNLLRGRPIWLAARVQPDELETVLAAHRDVSRIAHRAILVVVPENVDQAEAFHTHLRDTDFRMKSWANGELPEETTQVLLADTQGEMGLWYRLAPITFMGSSLNAHHSGRDPNEPAAHGSAILHGPYSGRFFDSYTRYAAAGGAIVVKDADALARAVKHLVPADNAAAMAAAAWEVSTRGAAVTDTIMELITEALELQENAS